MIGRESVRFLLRGDVLDFFMILTDPVRAIEANAITVLFACVIVTSESITGRSSAGRIAGSFSKELAKTAGVYGGRTEPLESEAQGSTFHFI